VARRSTAALPDDLYQRLHGDDLASRSNQAIVLCTIGANGWPHPAMLSYFEVAAVDHENLRLAVYANSRTCANLRERGKATLIIADVGLVYYVSGEAEQLASAMRDAPYNTKLNLRVVQVVFDEPPPELEPGASVTSGITYRPRAGEALARSRAVRAELLNG
jgi:hypothetical protein